MSADNVVSFHRTYGKAKSFPLTQTTVKMANPINGSISPYVAVFYHTQQITESAEVMCHGNAIQESKPYFRTSKDVLEKTKEILSKGMKAKKLYDQVSSESGGVFFSSSQSTELRDTRQIYRQPANLKREKKENESHGHLHGELESIINFQRGQEEFVKTLTCIRDSFYVFLGTAVQLNDVAKFCCEMNEVLYIDTTFNLWEHWLTDSCYGNLRLETNEGKHPILIAPSMIHFQSDEFLFNRIHQ